MDSRPFTLGQDQGSLSREGVPCWEMCTRVCAQSCPSLRPQGPPGSSVHGIILARVLDWGAISLSRDVGRQGRSNWALRMEEALH